MSHTQFALLKYPDEIVPELVSFDCVHEQPPEHVTVVTQVAAIAQGSPLGPVNPTLQVQVVSDALPLGELVFAGHLTQVVSSATVVEYVSTAQSVHTPLAFLY
jgi:hypothetical protein